MPYNIYKKKPAAEQLAKHDAKRNLPHYKSLLDTHAAFWEEQREQIDDPGDAPRHMLANTLLKYFDPIGRGVKALNTISDQTKPEITEALRRQALSLIAMSFLCKDLVTADMHIYDAVGQDDDEVVWGTLTPDGPQISADYKICMDGRLHLMTEAADALVGPRDPRKVGQAQWYFNDETALYVRRNGPPAKPTEEHMQDMMREGLAAPFDMMETLFPYLPAR